MIALPVLSKVDCRHCNSIQHSFALFMIKTCYVSVTSDIYEVDSLLAAVAEIILIREIELNKPSINIDSWVLQQPYHYSWL